MCQNREGNVTAMEHRGKRKRWKNILYILKLLLLVGIAVVLPAIVYVAHPEIINEFNSLDKVNQMLAQYHTASTFIYVGAQVLQIVICVIPGQMLQFAAGYAYSFWMGFGLSILGIGLGTTLSFYLARLLGKDAMHMIFGEERITHFITLLSSKKAYIVIFILYLIPGFPKDLITYAAGVSEIQIRPYLILSLIGRSPALMATILIGSMTRTGSYLGVILMCTAAAVIFLCCIWKRKQLMAAGDWIYDHLNHPKHSFRHTKKQK